MQYKKLKKVQMKYFIRSVKSFIWFVIIFAIILTILIMITPEYSFGRLFDPEGGMFVEGAAWKITAFFLLVAAIYPALTYVRKEVLVDGTFDDHRDKILGVFESMGYELTGEDSEKASFRLKSRFTRFMRMYEDGVTITKGESPLILEGARKDILRISSRIMVATARQDDNDNGYENS